MSVNLDLVRSLYTGWERGDFGRSDWAHPEIECVVLDGPTPDSGTGLAGMVAVWHEVIAPYQEFRATAEEYREIDERRVLVFVRFSGRGKASRMEIDQMLTKNACVFEIEDGKVRRLLLYWDRDRALSDLGLKERPMSPESTTPDLVEAARRMLDAVNRRDVEAVGSLYAPDVVLDRSRLGLEVVQGRDSALQALASLWVPFEDLKLEEEEEITDLGNGVGLAVYAYRGRPRESKGAIQMRFAIVATGSDGLLDRVISYPDIDEARAAAERLAQERE